MEALRREVEQLRAEKAVAIQGRDNQVLFGYTMFLLKAILLSN